MLHLAYTSVFVENQQQALEFYTGVLGLTPAFDVPLGGEDRWLTVRSSDEPGAVELLLEPNKNPIALAFQQGLKAAGIPCTSLRSDNLAADVERLKAAGVVFTQEPTDMGPVTIATLDDTCGNLLQLMEPKA